MSKSAPYAALIQANAQRIGEMHARIHETLKGCNTEKGRKIWEQACAEFHASYDTLAFPGGYESGLERIAHHNHEAIEAALVFLELRPYFFRSGYMRQKLMRLLKQASLSSKQMERLSAVVEAQRQWRAKAQLTVQGPTSPPSAGPRP